MEQVFQEFGKISRLNRDITITEKLDGTNAAIGILPTATGDGCDGTPVVYAQSRSRIITPGDDNFGFATWVGRNKDALALLGPGLHFGEWWGVGIQRGYGLSKRTFSLFNTSRWGAKDLATLKAIQSRGVDIDVVPVLYEGPWNIELDAPIQGQFAPDKYLCNLRVYGSRAVPGYMKPEGIVIYHKASRSLFKATVEKDEAHKSEPRNP